jgi:hypothetical protein
VKNAKYGRVKNAKYKQMFFYHPCCERGARGAHFFRKPPAFHRLSFHAPIRGGYWGEGGFSKIDCSDTTQSLQERLEGRFKKDFLALNVGEFEPEELFLMSSQSTNS